MMYNTSDGCRNMKDNVVDVQNIGTELAQSEIIQKRLGQKNLCKDLVSTKLFWSEAMLNLF